MCLYSVIDSAGKREYSSTLFPYIRAASTSIMHSNEMSHKLWLPSFFLFIRHQLESVMSTVRGQTGFSPYAFTTSPSILPSARNRSKKIFFAPRLHPSDKPAGKEFCQCNTPKPVTFITLRLFTYPICCSIFTKEYLHVVIVKELLLPIRIKCKWPREQQQRITLTLYSRFVFGAW